MSTRLQLYKRRAPVQEEDRRRKLAAQRREQRDSRRTNAFAANRGIQEQPLIPEEPVVSSRQQKLEEWKKKKQQREKEKKPAFKFTKVKYDDMHLYKPFESTTFNPPKGVLPVEPSQSERRLRSNTRNQKGTPQTVKAAVGAFTSAMAKATLKRPLKIPKPQIPVAEETNTVDVLNRTFDGTPTPSTCAAPESNIFRFDSKSTAKEEIFSNVLDNILKVSQANPFSLLQNSCQKENQNERMQIRNFNRKSAVQREAFKSIPVLHHSEITESVQRSLDQPAEEKTTNNFSIDLLLCSQKENQNGQMQTRKSSRKSTVQKEVLRSVPAICHTEITESIQRTLEQVAEEKTRDNFSQKENENEQSQTRKSNRKSTVQKEKSVPATCHPEMTEETVSIQRTLEQSAGEKTADYFRSLHRGAVEKLNSLCNEWTTQRSQSLPDAVIDEVDVAVGYAQLLISQKLQQFLDLIAKHEEANSSSELKVLSTDLDGFWGMVNNQLTDIYRKFDKLQTLKLNNWQESSSLLVKGHSQNISKKPKIIKSKGNASLGLRSFLAQARKQAQSGVDENRKLSVVLDTSSVEMPRPMSPIVMRVASRAKQIGSPQTLATVSTPRSPLRIVQPENMLSHVQTPKSIKRTPASKKAILVTPGSRSPVRRSTRLLSKD